MGRKEQFNDLEKNVNKRIIRIIIWWVLIFEKIPDAVERLKKRWKEVYVHLIKEYKKFKKEMGV